MLCLGRFVTVGGGGSSCQFRLAGSCLLTNVRAAAKSPPHMPADACRQLQTSFRLMSVNSVSRASQPTAAAAATVGDSTTEAVVQTVADAGALVDPSFPVLGLAHAYPSGWVQAIMEVLHVDAGMSWCATIATSTLLLRLLIFPVMVQQRKAAVKTNNIAPQIQRIQLALQASTDKDEQRRLALEFQEVYKKQGISPLAPIKPMIFSGIAFTSMFFGIRGMATAPVPSMTTGGLGWFTDLTVADPIFLLPVLTASTLAYSLHINAEGADTNSMPPMMLTFLKFLPWISLVFMMQFPAALNFYWLTNNAITLCQAKALSKQSVRQRLGIGELTVWRDEDLPLKNNPFGWMGKAEKTLEQRVKEEQAREDERRRNSK